MKKKNIVERFEAIKKQRLEGKNLLNALNSLVKNGKNAPVEKQKPAGHKSVFVTGPEPQIFTPTTNVYNSLNFEGQHYAIVEPKPLLPRSALPQEARGKRPSESIRKQQVSLLKRKLATKLHSEATLAKSKEADRLSRLAEVQDPAQKAKLELQFQIDRARTIQHLTEMAEYVICRMNQREVRQLEAKLELV